jgi:hypothetical protein
MQPCFRKASCARCSMILALLNGMWGRAGVLALHHFRNKEVTVAGGVYLLTLSQAGGAFRNAACERVQAVAARPRL